MSKSLRKEIASSTSTRATRKLERVLSDLSGKKDVALIGGSHYIMVVYDDFARYTWVLCNKHKSDTSGSLKEFLSPVSDHGQVRRKVRADEGGEFISQAFKDVCSRHKVKPELSTADSLQINGVAGRKLGIIEIASKAAQIQAPRLFPVAAFSTRDDIWTEGASWAADSLNRSTMTSNPDRT